MKSIYKIILFTGTIIFIVSIIWFGTNISPGSYSGTPKYKLNLSEDKVINSIHNLKKIDSTLNVPIRYNMIEGRKESTDHWYHFFISYDADKSILNCWVRGDTKSTSTLAFVSILNKDGKWKSLDNVSSNEQKNLKIEFEKRFLNKLIELNNKK